jgi:hypothetical protein
VYDGYPMGGRRGLVALCKLTDLVGKLDWKVIYLYQAVRDSFENSSRPFAQWASLQRVS